MGEKESHLLKKAKKTIASTPTLSNFLLTDAEKKELSDILNRQEKELIDAAYEKLKELFESYDEREGEPRGDELRDAIGKAEKEVFGENEDYITVTEYCSAFNFDPQQIDVTQSKEDFPDIPIPKRLLDLTSSKVRKTNDYLLSEHARKYNNPGAQVSFMTKLRALLSILFKYPLSLKGAKEVVDEASEILGRKNLSKQYQRNAPLRKQLESVGAGIVLCQYFIGVYSPQEIMRSALERIESEE